VGRMHGHMFPTKLVWIYEHTVCVGEHESPSQINMLPITDLNPSYGLQCFDAVGWAAGRASGL